MKIGGEKINSDGLYEVFIPTSEDDGVIFKCKAVRNMVEFDKLVSEPDVPMMFKPGEKEGTPNLTDPKYIKKKAEYDTLRYSFFVLESLSATPDLEWETVDKADPKTWGNYATELGEVFTNIDVNKIINGVLRANSLDEEYVKLARERFLAGRKQKEDLQSSLKAEQATTPSGTPVTVSE
jgi:hypothetical protein